MRRQKAVFPIEECDIIKQKMLNWGKQFSIFLLLDSNAYRQPGSLYDCLLAVNPVDTIPCQTDALDSLYDWHQQHQDWLFGHIAYDYKNKLEPRLRSKHTSGHAFPDFFFFCPEIICTIGHERQSLTIESMGTAPTTVYDAICAMPMLNTEVQLPTLSFQQQTSRDVYLAAVNQLREHIAKGDCYEINYCCEGFATDAVINPAAVFQALNRLSPAPFAALYCLDGQHMICTSPERYLKKTGQKILSQPIKGTTRRHPDPAHDKALRDQLYTSTKDRAENMMIVDLVRSDLAASCITGSIQVPELFEIYTFPQVHQMVSTVCGTLRENAPFTDAIRYSFPMGSMTGAPKIKVMELTEQYEQTRRGLFAGTVGYITPGADFDFNVVIRSLFYQTGRQYLSYMTGGAITYDSNPMQEWEEMRLKAWALERVFSSSGR